MFHTLMVIFIFWGTVPVVHTLDFSSQADCEFQKGLIEKSLANAGYNSRVVITCGRA